MGWFFSNTPSPTPDNNVINQQKKEEDLIEELPKDLASYYQLKNQENEFQFPTQKRRYNESELASVQCADFQVEYLNCITDGKFTEKLKGCTIKLEKFQNCLKFQKELFFKLGLSYCENEDRLDDVLAKADSLTLKWFDKSDSTKPLSAEVLKDVYDERDKIWK